MNPSDLVKHRATELGFALCGVCDARPTDHADHLLAWIAAGKHGEMAWLADHIDLRADPAALLPGARSLIVVADSISTPPPKTADSRSDADSRTEDEDHSLTPAPAARIARYAQLSDYHKVIKRRLHALADELRAAHAAHQFRVCVDTAPILEREHAQRSGVGWTGKHTLTINRTHGSHLLLGVIVTTLDLEPDSPETDHCGACTRCIDACPTHCITPYSIDASRCISYLTIEHRSTIDPALHDPIGDWLYGCDICQDVCPHVIKAAHTSSPLSSTRTSPPHYQTHAAALNPLDVLDWSEKDRRAAFRDSPMKRAKLDQIRRNAAIAAANLARNDRLSPADRVRLDTRLREMSADPCEPAMVRETATSLILATNSQATR